LRTLLVLAALSATLNLSLAVQRTGEIGIAAPYSALAFFFPCVISFGAFWLFFFGMIRRGEQKPIACTLTWFRERSRRLVFAILALQIISIGLSAFTALKIALPSVRPFSDFALARVDAAMIGHAPWASWTMSRLVLPPTDAIYSCWSLVQGIFVAAAALSARKDDRDRALISYLLIWGFGLTIAYIFPTAGPIFYDRAYAQNTYSSLDAFLHGSSTEKIADYLWNSGGVLGGGIFAMPSIHVAGAIWIAVAVRHLWPRAFPVAVTYAVVIAFGSVFLGWHYLPDALAGFALTIVSWSISGWIIGKSESASSNDALVGRHADCSLLD
jgi:hypothetical protein